MGGVFLTCGRHFDQASLLIQQQQADVTRPLLGVARLATRFCIIYMSQICACGSVHASICDSLLLEPHFSTGNCPITTESYRLAGLGGPYSRVPTFDFQPFRTVFLFFLLIACSGSFVQFPAVLSEQPGVVTPRQDR